jgi:hypothetical protein
MLAVSNLIFGIDIEPLTANLSQLPSFHANFAAHENSLGAST